MVTEGRVGITIEAAAHQPLTTDGSRARASCPGPRPRPRRWFGRCPGRTVESCVTGSFTGSIPSPSQLLRSRALTITRTVAAVALGVVAAVHPALVRCACSAVVDSYRSTLHDPQPLAVVGSLDVVRLATELLLDRQRNSASSSVSRRNRSSPTAERYDRTLGDHAHTPHPTDGIEKLVAELATELVLLDEAAVGADGDRRRCLYRASDDQSVDGGALASHGSPFDARPVEAERGRCVGGGRSPAPIRHRRMQLSLTPGDADVVAVASGGVVGDRPDRSAGGGRPLVDPRGETTADEQESSGAVQPGGEWQHQQHERAHTTNRSHWSDTTASIAPSTLTGANAPRFARIISAASGPSSVFAGVLAGVGTGAGRTFPRVSYDARSAARGPRRRISKSESGSGTAGDRTRAAARHCSLLESSAVRFRRRGLVF